VNDKSTVAFFAGTAAGALGWGPKVPHEIEDSMKEAFRGIEKRNWKSCVVMCRRALQALMEVAYEKHFGVKPGKGLDLNGIIRSFEKLAPPPIPRHWLNIADAVRNIGNVPGAHPRPIPSYRFSKGDATLAYSNTSSFVSAYFEKIAP
jgi:HEPN domain-containing protein